MRLLIVQILILSFGADSAFAENSSYEFTEPGEYTCCIGAMSLDFEVLEDQLALDNPTKCEKAKIIVRHEQHRPYMILEWKNAVSEETPVMDRYYGDDDNYARYNGNYFEVDFKSDAFPESPIILSGPSTSGSLIVGSLDILPEDDSVLDNMAEGMNILAGRSLWKARFPKRIKCDKLSE